MKMPRWAENAQATEAERDRREAKITIPGPGDRNPDRRIAEIGRIARELANPSGLPSHERIRLCAGDPDNTATDDMTKALGGIETALAELSGAPVRVPPKRPKLPKIQASRRPKPVRPFDAARPPAKPPAASIPPPAATPRIVGPSDHLDDGRHLAAALAFYDFRDRLAGDLRAGKVSSAPGAIVAHATANYGINPGDAAELTERFLASLNRDLHRRAA